MAVKIAPPASDEYAEFHKGYIAAVANESDGLTALEQQRATIDKLRHLTPEQSSFRYADGKWSPKEVIGHLADGERVLSYRLLRIGRADQTPLPGYDEGLFVANSQAATRDLQDLVGELSVVREATIALVRSLDDRALAHRGTVNNWSLSARGLVFIVAGHFAHHVKLFRDRYQIPL